MRTVCIALLVVLAGGCWNGGNSNVRLGDVSLGQQFIDLKRAVDEGALTATEYEQAKARLLKLTTGCEGAEEA